MIAVNCLVAAEAAIGPAELMAHFLQLVQRLGTESLLQVDDAAIAHDLIGWL